MANEKMTKRDMYNLIIATNKDNQAIVEFCEHEIELLERKKSNGNKKANVQMEQNVAIVYQALEEIGRPATASDLIANCDLGALKNEIGVVSTQKVSSYLKKLVDSGKAKKFVDKKKTYFELVNEEN